MSSLKEIGDALAAALDTVDGLRVHRYPPDQLAEFPCAMVYTRRGTLQRQYQLEAQNFHEWNVDVLANRQNAAQAAADIEPYLDAIQNALWADWDLNQTVDHIGTDQSISFEMVAYEYAGKVVFGYRLTIPTKQHRTIT